MSTITKFPEDIYKEYKSVFNMTDQEAADIIGVLQKSQVVVEGRGNRKTYTNIRINWALHLAEQALRKQATHKVFDVASLYPSSSVRSWFDMEAHINEALVNKTFKRPGGKY